MNRENTFKALKKYGYTITDMFNGVVGNKRRQLLIVISTALVPADWNGDKNIIAKVLLEGKRGAQYIGFMYKDQRIIVIG